MLKKIVMWIVTILWAATIFNFSAQPATESSNLSQGVIERMLNLLPQVQQMTQVQKEQLIDSVHTFVRKTAHFCIYAVLGVCIALLLSGYGKTSFSMVWHAILWGGLYAASDEIHQLFVPGRSGEVADVLLDTCGVGAGALFVIAILFIWKKWMIKSR